MKDFVIISKINLKTTITFLVFFCLVQVLLAQSSSLQFTVSKTDPPCPNKGIIKITVQNAVGTPLFSLTEVSTGQVVTPSASLLYEYLGGGDYIVSGTDNNSVGIPTTETVTLIDNYQPLFISGISGVPDETIYCSHNGVLTLAWSGGQPPYKITYTNTTATPSIPVVVTGHAANSFTATNLRHGTYSYSVEDNCTSTQYGSNLLVGDPLGRLYTFADDALTGVFVDMTTPSGWVTAKGVPGACNKMSIIVHGQSIFYKTQKNPSGYNMYTVGQYWGLSETILNNMYVAIEYPASSTPGTGTLTSFAPYVTPWWITINNFDAAAHLSPGQHPKQFRFVVMDPCDHNKKYYSNLIDFPYDNAFEWSSNNNPYKDYCTTNPYLQINLNTNERYITNYACKGPYKAQLYEVGTGGAADIPIGGLQDLTGDNFSTGWAPYLGHLTIDENKTYYAIVSSTSSSWSYRMPNHNPPPLMTLATRFQSFVSYLDNWHRIGDRFQYCDFDTTSVLTRISHPLAGHCIKYSITDLNNPSFYRPPIEICNDPPNIYSDAWLWQDIPWGNYEVTMEYYCGNNLPSVNSFIYTHSETKQLNLDKPANDFFAEASYSNSSTCSLFDITAKGGFSLNYPATNSWSREAFYWRAIVTKAPHPEYLGSKPAWYCAQPLTILSHVARGAYEIVIFPHYAHTNPATGLPLDMNSDCVHIFNFDIPEYVVPVIDNLRSGGFACNEGGTATLHITLKYGNPVTCYYQMRNYNDPLNPGEWSPLQKSNIYEEVAPGRYEVRVNDGCGTYTSILRVYDQGDQIVEIIGEFEPHKLCESMSVTLSPGSVGPAVDYLWEFSKNNNPYSWNFLTDDPAYFIELPSVADLGYYRLSIDNGFCKIQSDVYFTDVLPPSPRPTIVGDDAMCPGDPVLLTVIVNPAIINGVYHWYKDGEHFVDVMNDNTLMVLDTGSYTVVADPNSECPSWPSTIHFLEHVDSPDSKILSADIICPNTNPVIHINPSLTGVTYKIFDVLPVGSGTSLGTALGTGGAIHITVNDKPVSPTTYYVEASIEDGTCPPPPRTPLVMTFGTLPDAPTHSLECNVTPVGTANITVTHPTGSGYQYSLNSGNFQPSNIFTEIANGTACIITVKNADGCTTSGTSFNTGYECGATVRGTVFPFVNREENDAFAESFNSQFAITVRLKAVPTFATKPTEAELTAFFNGPYKYTTTAVLYTGMPFVPNTPEHPGALGEFTNYGEPINFGPIGKTHVPGTPRILLNGEAPFTIEGTTVGLFEFNNVVPGDYILEISRPSHMIRWAKITVNGTDAIQNQKHREIIPGYIITDDLPTYLKIYNNDAEELVRLIEKGIYYQGTGYDPKYDLNADGYIDAYDYYLLKKYINFMHEHYEDTWNWINEY